MTPSKWNEISIPQPGACTGGTSTYQLASGRRSSEDCIEDRHTILFSFSEGRIHRPLQTYGSRYALARPPLRQAQQRLEEAGDSQRQLCTPVNTKSMQ